MTRGQRGFAYLIVGLAVTSTASAALAESPRVHPAPSLERLWRAFPLREPGVRASRLPRPRPAVARPATAAPHAVAHGASGGFRPPPAAGGSDASYALELRLGAALLLAFGSVALAWRYALAGRVEWFADRRYVAETLVEIFVVLLFGVAVGWLIGSTLR